MVRKDSGLFIILLRLWLQLVPKCGDRRFEAHQRLKVPAEHVLGRVRQGFCGHGNLDCGNGLRGCLTDDDVWSIAHAVIAAMVTVVSIASAASIDITAWACAVPFAMLASHNEAAVSPWNFQPNLGRPSVFCAERQIRVPHGCLDAQTSRMTCAYLFIYL